MIAAAGTGPWLYQSSGNARRVRDGYDQISDQGRLPTMRKTGLAVVTTADGRPTLGPPMGFLVTISGADSLKLTCATCKIVVLEIN